ncbi:MAG: recombinase family protein [Syntrophobacteraceae bacterium]
MQARLVLNLLTSLAQWERETIGERTRDALRRNGPEGKKPAVSALMALK